MSIKKVLERRVLKEESEIRDINFKKGIPHSSAEIFFFSPNKKIVPHTQKPLEGAKSPGRGKSRSSEIN